MYEAPPAIHGSIVSAMNTSPSPLPIFTVITFYSSSPTTFFSYQNPQNLFKSPSIHHPLKDLSSFSLFFLFLLKMRKGIRNFCNDDCSTSILNQQNHDPPPPESNPTLEEMILQLELEEDIAKKENRRGVGGDVGLRGGGGGRRMSCVNNSDILRSARNALNQYPRFSLDGKDAMYRSSFRNNFGGGTEPGRKSVCCDYGIRERLFEDVFDSKLGRKSSCSLGGQRESVVWCEPGLIAKLMGLEAMPAPSSSRRGRETLSCIVRRPDLRNEMERRLVAVDGGERMKRGRKGGYCVMKPVAAVEAEAASGGGVWPTRRFI